VYAGNGSGRLWDGNVNGKPLPVGVYYYVIDIKNGKPALTGSLTIIR
jgi:gliding motility-associated-like protein